ncbi:sugar MFS transporter [Sporichthya sp.]|uniref:MFS transporter n=1 Tax=Sporichthya sp. TaxID=65475 RepID=UPI00179E552B|nr:MFS transporter [Sporichthya sp.]MBA3743400.1 MFS transporter [Sporichthya sp.]
MSGDRDRLTLLVYCQLGLWGYFLFGFGPVVPILRDELDISNTVAGLHATMISAGSITASSLYPRLARGLGRGLTARVGMAGLAAGVAILCSWDLLAVTLTGTFIAGGFGSLLVTGSAVILRERHEDKAPAAITEANAVAAAFGLIAPALIGIAAALQFGWRPVLLGVVVLAVALAFTLGREPVPDGVAPDRGTQGKLPRKYWGAWLVVAMVIGVEAAMTVWSSDLLRDSAGMGNGGAAAGVSVLLAGMLTGRLLGPRFASRRPAGVLLAALFLAGGGFIVFWTAGTPVQGLTGLALMGLGMSLHYPLAVTAAIEAGDGHPDLAAGRAALGVGVAAATVPLLMGAMSDAAGIQAAFTLVPILLAVAVTSLIVSGRRPAEVATLDD